MISRDFYRTLDQFIDRCENFRFLLIEPPHDSPSNGIELEYKQLYHDPDPRLRSVGVNFVDRKCHDDFFMKNLVLELTCRQLYTLPGGTRSSFIDVRSEDLHTRLEQ